MVPKDDIVMEYVTLDTFRRLRLGRRTSPGAYGMLALATVVVVARWLHECHRGKSGASTVQPDGSLRVAVEVSAYANAELK